jgi:hypothetical protein
MDKRDILIFDLCIARPVMPKFSKPESDISYCSNWTDFEHMGISIIGTYDYRECRSRAFLNNNLEAFQRLLSDYNLLVGFNNHQFGERLLAENGIVLPSTLQSYDLGFEVKEAGGEDFKLEELAQANLTTDRKWRTSDKSLAPIWFQRGDNSDLINYCIAGVWIIKKLFDLVFDSEPLCAPTTPSKLIYLKSPINTI